VRCKCNSVFDDIVSLIICTNAAGHDAGWQNKGEVDVAVGLSVSDVCLSVCLSV